MKAHHVDKDKRQIVAVCQAYNEVDAWGDVFVPGCFDKSLEHKSILRVVHNYNFDRVIGTAKLTSDATGLLADIKLSRTETANEVFEFKEPFVTMGFLVHKQQVDTMIREIQEAYVHVISVDDKP